MGATPKPPRVQAAGEFINPLFIVLMVTVMIGVATENAARRGQGLAGLWWKILLAIGTTECLMLGFRPRNL